MVKNKTSKRIKRGNLTKKRFITLVIVFVFLLSSAGFFGWKKWHANRLSAEALSYTNWTTLGGGLNWGALACKVKLPSGLYNITVKLHKNTNDFYVILSSSNGRLMELRAASLVRQFTLNGNVWIWVSIGKGGPPVSVNQLRNCY
jgi:hypothetical protein